MRSLLTLLCLFCVGMCYASEDNPVPTDLIVFVAQPEPVASDDCAACQSRQQNVATKNVAAGSCSNGTCSTSSASSTDVKSVGRSVREPKVRRGLFGRSSSRVRGSGSCSSGGCQ